MASAPYRTTAEILQSLARSKPPTVQNGNSATANKLNVRLPDGMRDQILERCKAEHIAINSYVVQALEEKLVRGARPTEMLEHISTQLASIAAHLGIPADESAASATSAVTDADAKKTSMQSTNDIRTADHHATVL